MMGGKSDQLVTDPAYADLINRLGESVPIITTGKVEAPGAGRFPSMR